MHANAMALLPRAACCAMLCRRLAQLPHSPEQQQRMRPPSCKQAMMLRITMNAADRSSCHSIIMLLHEQRIVANKARVHARPPAANAISWAAMPHLDAVVPPCKPLPRCCDLATQLFAVLQACLQACGMVLSHRQQVIEDTTAHIAKLKASQSSPGEKTLRDSTPRITTAGLPRPAIICIAGTGRCRALSRAAMAVTDRRPRRAAAV